MNYAALTSAVLAFTGNTDTAFAAQIPTFVANAEKRIYNAVDMPVASLTSTLATANTVPTVSVGAGVRNIQQLTLIASGTYTALIPKDFSFIRECYPTPATTGVPVHYAVDNELTVLLGPTPNAVFSIEMQYTGYPTSIVTAASTWLGDNFDHVLLYGCLVEAYTFMKGDEDMLKQYAGQLADGVAAMKSVVSAASKTDLFRQGVPR